MNWAVRLAELEQRQRHIVAQLDWVESTLASQRQRNPAGTSSTPTEAPPPPIVTEADKATIKAIERATANFLDEVRTGREAEFPHRETGRASRPQSVRRLARSIRDAEEARGVRRLPGAGGGASGSGSGR